MRNYLNEIDKLIKGNKISIIYFTGEACSACSVIGDKVRQLIKDYKEIEFLEINGEENQLIAANYSVFSLPLLILYVEGKESLRVGRYFDLLEFESTIDRYYNMLY